MKTLCQAIVLYCLVVGSVSAQGVTKKEAVKTTKIAQKNAKELQRDAKRIGNLAIQKEADKTLDAANRAEKQAKKNTNN